jgi:hypothetical protein
MKVVEHAGLAVDLCPSMNFGNSRLPWPTRRTDEADRVLYPTTNSGISDLLRVRRTAACEKRDQNQRARACHEPFHKPTLSAELPIDVKRAGPRILVEIERALRSLRAYSVEGPGYVAVAKVTGRGEVARRFVLVTL